MTEKPATKLSAAASVFTDGYARVKNMAGRLPRPRRRHLAVMAPLLATTALMGDAVLERPVLAPQSWGHATLTGQDLRLSANTLGAQDNTIPARCYTPKQDEPNPLFNRDDSSWRGFYMLANGGMFSRGLHQNARDLDMAVCETAEPNNIRNYDGSSRIAGISADGQIVETLREAAHGITHAIMQKNNLSSPAADEGLFSRLNRHLTAEAVAMTAEYVVAAEQASRGNTNLMTALHVQNAPGFAHFSANLQAAQRSGLTEQRAIARAASLTITHLVRQPEFITANSDPILRPYVQELSTAGMRPRRTSEFDRDDARQMGQWGRQSIAADVRLLTPAELATLSPTVASMVETLQNMHAVRTGYTPPRTYVDDNIYARVTLNGVLQEMHNAQGVYTARQAFERARTAPQHTYAGRSWQLRETFTFGMQSDYSLSQTPPAAAALWQQIDNLRRLSPTFGPHMADMAAQANIVMCYGPLSSTLLGLWQPDAGIIVLNTGHRHVAGNTRTLAHELLHVAQHNHGIGRHYDNWSLADIQASSLTRESAASVISILVAMEFKLYGDNSLWSFGNDQPRAERMWQVYTETRAGGATHQQSLEAAGRLGYALMFQRQWWLDIYNDDTARQVIAQLAAEWLKAPTGEGYTINMASLAGKVSETFNFTRGVTSLPDDQMAFGTNDQMRHLYDYIHLQHLTQTLGSSHATTRAQRRLMENEGSPYLGVDFKALAARVAADRVTPVLQHINCLANGTCSDLRIGTPSPRAPSCGS